MGNRYDILRRLPGYEADTIPLELELLAQQLVASGRLRLNADTARNFVTYSGPGFDKTLSYRELTDPNLLPDTRAMIARTLPGSAGEEGLNETCARLFKEMKTAQQITPEREMQVARLLVQATHPVVIHLCLLEGVDLFVSYAHNVADLMAVHFWESVGNSSGLQAVSGDGTAVYVSCGGNPFITDDAHKTFQSDGFGALARMQVIAAQELGHYADLLRDETGRIIGRHSATLAPLRARPAYAQARLDDLRQVAHWQHLAGELGVRALAGLEKEARFYAQHRPASPKRWWLDRQVGARREAIRRNAAQAGYALIARFPEGLHGSQGWATDLLACLRDMAFNLAPQAEAYRRDLPAEEEAVACIEALARVPQQAVKWGGLATGQCWPGLSRLYEEDVIPAAIGAYERRAGKAWHFPKLARSAGKSGRRRWQIRRRK